MHIPSLGGAAKPVVVPTHKKERGTFGPAEPVRLQDPPLTDPRRGVVPVDVDAQVAVDVDAFGVPKAFVDDERGRSCGFVLVRTTLS
jgi:hypothetical protein